MKWGIKEKLIGLSLCGIFLAAGIGISGYQGLSHVDEQMDGIVLSSAMMRSQLEADMMHDAVFGNVLSAVLAAETGNAAEGEAALKALAENTATFRDRLQELERKAPSQALRKAIEAAEPALAAYLKDAEDISRLAFEDREAALQALEPFNAAYERLASSMEEISDLIEKEVASAQAVGDEAVVSSKQSILSVMLITVLVLGLFSLFIILAVTKGLRTLSQSVQAVTAGNLTAKCTWPRKDEIGVLVAHFNQMTGTILTLVSRIKQNAGALSQASEELSLSSSQMSSSLEEAEEKAQEVADKSSETNGSVQTVSVAAEEMSATIKEISRNVQEANHIVDKAVGLVGSANVTISELGISSSEIGSVVKVISSIAKQTNLLALNATIEAARAGEAGKGFAVVANEVKELAKATATATQEISDKIVTIQRKTEGAVVSIGEIESVMKEVSNISVNISGAVEEQSATTDEIVRSVASVAQGTNQLDKNIAFVAEASRNTAEGASEVMSASQSLSKMGGELMSYVEKFEVKP